MYSDIIFVKRDLLLLRMATIVATKEITLTQILAETLVYNTIFEYFSNALIRRAVLKRRKTSVRLPSAVRQCPSPSDSPPTDGPSDHKKLLLTLPLSDVRPGANTVGSILYDVYTLGQNTV